MRNQTWPSIITAMLLTAAVVIGPGLALAGLVSSVVNPVNVDVPIWRTHYEEALGWSAGIAALLTAMWLFAAHSGDGLDTKTGLWYALWLAAIVTGALLAVLIPDAVDPGPGVPMAISALLVLAGYWIATLFLTPDHYRYTPLLGKALWARKK